ncbi:MAG: hypothetical protein CMP81_15400 [Fulvimarina sp.]|nr:hypothetical protein [Fulvimarina sp.]
MHFTIGATVSPFDYTVDVAGEPDWDGKADSPLANEPPSFLPSASEIDDKKTQPLIGANLSLDRALVAAARATRQRLVCRPQLT